jgi:hypothetical protein
VPERAMSGHPHGKCGTNPIPGNLTETARFHRMARECRTSFGSFLDFRSPYDRLATMARLASRARHDRPTPSPR